MAEVQKFRFPLRLRPRPPWKSLQRSPDPLRGFKKSHTSKGRRGAGRGEREKGKGEGIRKWREGGQGRIQVFAKGGRCLPFPSPLPFSPHFPSPFRVRALKLARGLRIAVNSPSGVRVQPRPKKNLVHSTVMLSESCWWQSF